MKTDLNDQALMTYAYVLSALAPDEESSQRCTQFAGWLAKRTTVEAARAAYEDAKILISNPPTPPTPPTPSAAPAPPVGQQPLKVWVLTAEINGAAYTAEDVCGDYIGHTSAHMTLSGAIDTLDRWLSLNGFDASVAHVGEIRTPDFVGADVDPDMIDGDHLSWGVNLTTVQK